MKKTSKHINIIVKILFVFIFLIIAFFIVLANGISIKKLDFLNIEITELYLKLDKKLILNANEVYIKKANNNKVTNINELRQKIVKLKEYKQLLTLFQNINIKSININNNNIKLYYDQKNLNITSEIFQADLNINPNLNELIVNVTNLKYKDLSFYGELKIAKNIEIRGYLHSINNDLSSKINIINNKNDFSLDIENIEIKNQQLALKHFDAYLTPKLREWLLNRVNFKNFKGSFAFYIKKNKLVKSLGDGIFYDVNAVYNDKAPAVYAKEVRLDLKDLELNIKSQSVSSNNVNLSNFNLNFDKLIQPNIKIDINATKLSYNDTIEKIINAYGIKLGLRQISGNTSAKVIINLKNTHKHDVLVDVKTNGTYIYNNFKFNASANVNVNNNQILISGDANTDEISLKNAIFRLDTSTKLGSIEAKNLKIDYKDYFYYNNNATIGLNMQTKILDFTNLNTKINLNNTLQINANIKDILPYSKKLNELKFSDGLIELITKNNILNLNITNAEFDLGIYKNTPNDLDLNNKYKNDDFYINIQNNETKINTKSKLLTLNINKNKTTINASNIIIDASNLDNNSNSSNLELNLYNSKIFYKNNKLDLTKLIVDKNAVSTIIKASFKHGGELNAKLTNQEFLAYIRKLNYKSLNELANKQVFISGELDMDIKGRDFKDFDGLINIRSAYLANTKNYINLIAFIESVPSIVTLHKPGFTKKGLGVKFGSVEFKYKNDLIDINNINILGYSIDCNGNGFINTKTKTADLTLNVFTLKNTNKIISNIPIVKQIFIGGKNNKIATQLRITGNIDNLEYKTSLAKDILTSPFVLLKNIVSLPKNLISK